jgi:hypothetical protein
MIKNAAQFTRQKKNWNPFQFDRKEKIIIIVHAFSVLIPDSVILRVELLVLE